MILRIFFGYYCVLGKSTLLRIFFFIFCLLTAITYQLVLVKYWDLVGKYYSLYIYNTIEYIANFILSFIFKGTFMRKTCQMLTNSGDILNNKSIKVSWVIATYFIAMYLCRLWSFISLTSVPTLSLPYWINIVLITALYLDFYTKTLCFDVLYQRMKLLKSKFECNFCTVNLICEEGRNYKINHMKKCLTAYSILLDYVQDLDYEIILWVSL